MTSIKQCQKAVSLLLNCIFSAFYRKRNRVLTRTFPREHSIFLFYVQRYTQTPDLAVNSDPHRGADRIVVVVDIVAVPIDRAVIVDIGGIILIVAGRPQPPPAEKPIQSDPQITSRRTIIVFCRCSSKHQANFGNLQFVLKSAHNKNLSLHRG